MVLLVLIASSVASQTELSASLCARQGTVSPQANLQPADDSSQEAVCVPSSWQLSEMGLRWVRDPKK